MSSLVLWLQGNTSLNFLIYSRPPGFTQTSLLFSAAMICGISLNLQLVLMHGVDGRMMENACWFTNPTASIQFCWVIGSQSFWILLIASLEFSSFVVLVCFMVRNQRHSTRILSSTTTDEMRYRCTQPNWIVFVGDDGAQWCARRLDNVPTNDGSVQLRVPDVR
ncbi:hypothetical protein B0H17DRAFT_1130343 [Mycena rosella]|uniref:Uncharacterized protein n=1 Tax=Mycena rosella TaxID=1033263 RepID=A0AAD7DSX4_MYCRO|nr:hypothetical protein B0H17DRAFT_1130343 [Mycena rosella]